MATLHDVMLFLTERYPHPDELSNARLTKLIYLADWRAAITKDQQITQLAWHFNHYGPYLTDIIEEAQASDDFDVARGQTMYGSRKKVIARREDSRATPSLEPWEQSVLEHVIQATRDLSWSEFIELVYSTYPIVSEDRYNTLDLVQLAQQYKRLRHTLPGESHTVG